jgi:hypothetical protein
LGVESGGGGLTLERLARLARGLEAGGIYNGSKLVRALLERERARMALDAPTDAQTVGAEAARVADALSVAGEDPALVASLRAAARAAEAGSTLPLSDAPRTWTCRNCGRISLGSVAAWCPTCESPVTQAREELPVWYLEPIQPAEALERLEDGLEALDSILADCPDESMERPPAVGEWSVRDVLRHLVAAEELLATRVPRLLDEDYPDLVATAAWILPASDEATSVTDASADTLLARLGTLRRGTIARLRATPAEDWERTGHHPEWGTVTVTSQAGYFARHLWSHLAQVRAAVDGRLPGRPPTP